MFFFEFAWEDKFAALFVSISFLILTIPITIVRGLIFFKTINRFKNDTTENSIIPLFDNGYTILLDDLESKISFTKENLKGTIGGLPVEVFFRPPIRIEYPCLIFRFYPLLQPDSGNDITKIIDFSLSFRYRLKKDIKPDVLKFVADLKARGYSVGPTSVRLGPLFGNTGI